MSRCASDAIRAAAAAALLAAVIAYPVLQAPSTRVFGAEIVGRHHDPFTVARQFEQPVHLGIYSQPVTDVAGALLARVTGRVAAYNWLVLLSFPLAAAAAFLLARHMDLSRGGAAFAALAFAFSPFHVAHAAYHPHVAQVQWVPLYLLALWCALDRTSPSMIVGLLLATVGVTLSNFYGGLIAAVLTPVAVAMYWFARVRGTPNAARSLIVTSALLAAIAAAGLGYVWAVAPAVLRDPAALVFDRSDLFRYSAKWWSYLVPPVASPWFGGLARNIWASADIREGLLEQQITLGAGVVLLGLVAIGAWMTRRRVQSAMWAGADPRGGRRDRVDLLPVAGTYDRRVQNGPSVGVALSDRAHVSFVRPVRCDGAAHGGSPGGPRPGHPVSIAGYRAAAGRRGARDTHRRRVRRRAGCAFTRRPAHDGASMGGGTGRPDPRARLHTARSRIGIG